MEPDFLSEGSRILTVVPNLGLGGTQRTAIRYAIMAKKLGYESAIYTYEPGQERLAELSNAEVKFFPYPISFDTVLAWNPNIVHFHRGGEASKLHSTMILLAKRSGAKIVETNIFSRPDYSPEGRLIDLRFQLSPWCWLRYHSRSIFMKGDAPSILFPNPADDFWGVSQDNNSRNRGRNLVDIPAEAFVFGRIAQPIPSKWMISVLNAFERIGSKYSNVWLCLVGPPPEFVASINRLGTDIRSRIRILEPISNDQCLADVYGSFDCFIHSAAGGESFGNVLVESMLCGTPVITESTLHKDNSQGLVVGHRRGGLVCAKASNLTEAMEIVVNDQELLKTLATIGRAHCIENYTVSAVLPRLKSVYDILLKSKSRDDLVEDLCTEGMLLSHEHVREAWKSRLNVIGSYSTADRIEFIFRNSGLLYWLNYQQKKWRQRKEL